VVRNTYFTNSVVVPARSVVIPFDTTGGVIVSNNAPSANAGSDATITYPTVTTALNGTGSTDSDGSIVSYAWTILSGSGGSIADATAATTTFTGTPGNTYAVRLTVTDDDGATGTDSKVITVNKASQTITFGTLSDKTVGDAPFTLSATSTSGLTVSVASSNTSVSTVTGTTVTLEGSGTTNIPSSQQGNGNSRPAR